MSVTIRVLVLALSCLAASGVARAATDVTLFRLFLTDGTSVVSYGEFARLSDRVIFSMPVGGDADQPRLHVVTLPVGAINWARTNRYTASARYQRYAETRGEDDFARLTNDVARALNEIALSADRSQALAMAEEVRGALVEWPRSRFGYRQLDVNEILMLLDEAISGLRAAAGLDTFDVALVATPAEVDFEPLFGMPTSREQLGQLLRVLELTDYASERTALLHSTLALLGDADAGSIPAEEAEMFRKWVEERIEAEELVDRRYEALSKRLMLSATRAAERANVGDVERVLRQLPPEDERLGHLRPHTVGALLASLQSELVAAQDLRLRRDRWLLRRSLYRDYERSVGSELQELVEAEPALEAVQRLEGPLPDRLVRLRATLSGGAERLVRQSVPADLCPTHDMYVSAWRFAENAFDTRLEAVQSGNIATAWQASSAAAGALLMLSQAQQQLSELLEPPQLR